jgi:hypothetical protein
MSLSSILKKRNIADRLWILITFEDFYLFKFKVSLVLTLIFDLFIVIAFTN